MADIAAGGSRQDGITEAACFPVLNATEPKEKSRPLAVGFCNHPPFLKSILALHSFSNNSFEIRIAKCKQALDMEMTLLIEDAVNQCTSGSFQGRALPMTEHAKVRLGDVSRALGFLCLPERNVRKDILGKHLEKEGSELGADAMVSHSNC
ncbi:Ectopic P Granules Protein 5 [Manis pentadactyla]|nr:Ectopic P Granules Protein 5 [Manis pentadactyla]